MKTIKKWGIAVGLGIFMAIIGFGCAQPVKAKGLKTVSERSCQDPEALLDVLTQFSTAISHKDFYQAVTYLNKEDQAKIIDSLGIISDELKRKMKALNFQALANNPKIDLVRGKLKGIFDCLPCLDESDSVVVFRDAKENPSKDTSAETDENRKLLKRLTETFYADIQNENWKGVANAIHPQELSLFTESNGNLSELNKNRFRAVKQCDFECLSLKNGHILGVVVLLEPPVSALWLKSKVFFDRIEAKRYDEAVAMLLESEKKRFVDSKGKIRPERLERLKKIDRNQWRKLYLYHDWLMGVSELALGNDGSSL